METDQKKEIKLIKNLLPTKRYVQRDINRSLDTQKLGTFDSKSSSRYQ